MIDPIHLDITLAELYGLDTEDHHDIYCAWTIPTTGVRMARGIPISKKYVYQDPLSHNDSATAGRIFAQLVPQLFGLITGKMNMIMFDLDLPDGNDIDPQPRIDAVNVLSQITEYQRPMVTYVRSAEDIVLPSSAMLAVANPMDCLEYLPSTVPFENHYRGLSKRDLVLSGLPTPKSVIVDTHLNADQVLNPHERAVEITRMLETIKQRLPPFVVKLPQALSGQGVFLVRKEKEREDALAVLNTEMDNMLLQLNHSNEHLHPTSLIVQEMVEGSAVAVAMFLRKTGELIVTSVCDQFVDSHGHWGGGHIDYSKQERLKTEYTTIAQSIGEYMHTLGYYGPLGADIMKDGDGRHLVIDLNIRITGSHPLGFLKGFFSERGYNDAGIFFPLFLNVDLEEFKARFRTELEERRMVIAGWCHEFRGRSGVSTVILAGEDEKRLGDLADRVKSLKTPGY